MKSINGIIYALTICLLTALTACKKEQTRPALGSGSISIQNISESDTLYKEMPIIKDSMIVVGLKATLKGEPAQEDHFVTFQLDTTKLAAYRAKYGSAILLPASSYFFFRSMCRIPAGAVESDSIQINLFGQTSLLPETVYVLPVTIEHVDGHTEAIAPGQVYYIVVKTGESPVISKNGWSILSVSSAASGGGEAQNVLDNNDEGTFWMSVFTFPMPQHLAIDFGKNVTFGGVTYTTPRSYFTSGYYPVNVKIEVSADGTNWIDKGTYTGLNTATGTITIGTTTARYMRFNVLQVFAAGFFKYVVIGGISVVH